MEPRPMEYLVCIDISDSGQRFLVEEQALQSPLLIPEDSGERLEIEPQGLRAELPDFPQAGERVRADAPHKAEFPDVPEAEFDRSAREAEDEMSVLVQRLAAREEEELPGHLEMDEEGQARSELHQDHFPAAAEAEDLLAAKLSPESGIRPPRRPGPGYPMGMDRKTCERPRQGAHHGFHFRKFWHPDILPDGVLICPPFSVKLFFS